MSLWPDAPGVSTETHPQIGQPTPGILAHGAAPLQLDASPPTVSPEISGPVAMGLEGAYGPQWQEPYGTTAGRTLTGATPNEAFPPATVDGNPAMRDALAQTFSDGHLGADHPEMQAVLRGALADGMTQSNRAVVNTAALDAAVARNPEGAARYPAGHPARPAPGVARPGRQDAPGRRHGPDRRDE